MSGAMPDLGTVILTSITVSDRRDRGVKQRARVRCKWAMGAVERRSPLQAEGSVSPAKS